MDLQMPGISGVELARELRTACGAGNGTLAMSASQPEKDVGGGFDGFLLKPFTMAAARGSAGG